MDNTENAESIRRLPQRDSRGIMSESTECDLRFLGATRTEDISVTVGSDTSLASRRSGFRPMFGEGFEMSSSLGKSGVSGDGFGTESMVTDWQSQEYQQPRAVPRPGLHPERELESEAVCEPVPGPEPGAHVARRPTSLAGNRGLYGRGSKEPSPSGLFCGVAKVVRRAAWRMERIGDAHELEEKVGRRVCDPEAVGELLAVHYVLTPLNATLLGRFLHAPVDGVSMRAAHRTVYLAFWLRIIRPKLLKAFFEGCELTALDQALLKALMDDDPAGMSRFLSVMPPLVGFPPAGPPPGRARGDARGDARGAARARAQSLAPTPADPPVHPPAPVVLGPHGPLSIVPMAWGMGAEACADVALSRSGKGPSAKDLAVGAQGLSDGSLIRRLTLDVRTDGHEEELAVAFLLTARWWAYDVLQQMAGDVLAAPATQARLLCAALMGLATDEALKLLKRVEEQDGLLLWTAAHRRVWERIDDRRRCPAPGAADSAGAIGSWIRTVIATDSPAYMLALGHLLRQSEVECRLLAADPSPPWGPGDAVGGPAGMGWASSSSSEEVEEVQRPARNGTGEGVGGLRECSPVISGVGGVEEPAGAQEAAARRLPQGRVGVDRPVVESVARRARGGRGGPIPARAEVIVISDDE
jgi:hypothetical protein